MNDFHTQPVVIEQQDTDAALEMLGFAFRNAKTGVLKDVELRDIALSFAEQRARLTTDRSLGAEARDTLEAIVAATTVGKRGSCVTRSKYGSYPSALYHRAVAVLAATPPVLANSEQVPMTFNDASSQDRRLAGLVALFRQSPGATLFRIHHPEQAAADIFERLLSVPANSGEGEKYRHVKRGTVYEVVGRASLQNANCATLSEAACMVIYRGDDGNLWAREESEFMDGRFAALATPDAAPIGSDDADYSGYVEEGADTLGDYPMAAMEGVEPVFVRQLMLQAMAAEYAKATGDSIEDMMSSARATWDTDWETDPAPRTVEAAVAAALSDLECWEGE
jgi:hypothetical protein